MRYRMNGHIPRAETLANSHLLKLTKEDAVVRYILDLETRGFPPQIAGVENMANLLLATRWKTMGI